jgi:putative ABC transport system permease protein
MTPRGSSRRWWLSFVRNLLQGERRDAELRDDVESFVGLLTDEKTAAGMPPDAARRAALLEVGSVVTVTEESRGVRAGALFAQVGQDVRYALRMMRRDLSFTLVAVVTLALGIGANTAIFSVVNAVLLEPLPYHRPDRLVLMWERNLAIGKDRDLVAPRNYQDWRQQQTTLDEIGAYDFDGHALSHLDYAEQLSSLSLSSSVFRVLAANAALGRVFNEEEERRRDRVVVLTHALWERRFGGDRRIVGRAITLDGAAFTVVGVMPPDFRFPDGNPVDLYTPLHFTPDQLTGRRAHMLMVIGRLRDGVTIDAGGADIGRIAQRIAAGDPTSNPEALVVGAHDALVEDVRLALVVLFGTVGFVLLIACANVANLLLVRATSRRREIAMRAALGAGRARLVRQLLTESVLLAVIGGAVGMVLARWLLQGFAGVQPPNLPRLDAIRIDTTVLLFVTTAAFATGVLFGSIPALQAATPRLSDATRTVSDDHPTRQRARSALLIAEVAISLMLLAGAGLMVRSLLRVQAVSLGFQPDQVLTAQLLLAHARYPTDPSQYRLPPSGAGPVPDSKLSTFFTQLEERLRAVAGIESVGAVSALPLNPVGADYDLPVIIEGKPRPRPGEEPQADFRTATAGYFRTLRIPLLSGREFNDFDGPNSTSVVIINDTLARQMFAQESPLGQRLMLYGRPREIVGVIGSVRHHGFSREPRPEMILPFRQFQSVGMTLVVRSRLERTALAAAVAGAVHALDSQQPVYRVRAMSELLADSTAQPRLTTMLLGGFAVLALVLALVGVYGVTSYAVSQRAREIAVRLALGAQRREVVRQVVRHGLGFVAIGVVIGLAGAAAGTRLMTGLLFGTTATDPLTFVAAAVAVVIVAVAATCAPAWRAARIAPIILLRSE